MIYVVKNIDAKYIILEQTTIFMRLDIIDQ